MATTKSTYAEKLFAVRQKKAIELAKSIIGEGQIKYG